jgi:hypothetical protein
MYYTHAAAHVQTDCYPDLASRLKNRVQISSDQLTAYVDAVDASFGANVDYAQIVKYYEAEPIGPGRYSPSKVVDAAKIIVWGNPDPEHISTSPTTIS